MPGASRPSERFWPDAPNQVGGPYPYANAQAGGGDPYPNRQSGGTDPRAGRPGGVDPYAGAPAGGDPYANGQGGGTDPRTGGPGGVDAYAGGAGAQDWSQQASPSAQRGASDPDGVPGPQALYQELPIPPPMQRPVARTRPVTRAAAAVVPIGIGAAVAVGLGVYGRVHNPTGVAIDVAGFSSTQSVKTWLATVAIVLAIVQLISAFAVYGKIPGPSWSGTLHKWSGRLAVLFTLPVVAHCLYALGFQYDTGRVLIHSVLGCFFFGAFAAKMLVLSRDDAPRGLLPVIGGLVFSALVGIWLTSALWFFTTIGFTF